jgi:hypothetical protein
VIWWVLGFPVFLLIVLSQIMLYRKLAATSPFNDGIIVAALIAQATIGLGIVFYYVFKHGYGSNNSGNRP